MSSGCPSLSEPVVTGAIAIDTIFLVAALALFLVWLVLRVVWLKVNSILKWYLYGLAIIFYSLSSMLDIAFYVMSACEFLGPGPISDGFIADSWLWYIALWLTLVEIMLILCGALFKAANGSGKIVYFISAPILFLAFVMIVSYLSLYAAQPSFDSPTQRQLRLAAEVFNLIGAIVSIALMLVALVQMVRRKVRLGSLVVWLPILMVFLLGSACAQLGVTIMEFHSIYFTTSSSLALGVFENVFFYGILLCLLFLSINPTIIEALNGPTVARVAQAPATAPMILQQQQMYDPNLSRYSQVPVQPGVQPVYGYQVPVGTQQQYVHQQQPVYLQGPHPPQKRGEVQLDSHEINDPNQQIIISPIGQDPVELPDPRRQPELP